jgi:hypothetical protein
MAHENTSTYKITDKEVIDRAAENISSIKRMFRRSKQGHYTGSGMEIVNKTSKFLPYRNLATKALTKVILHTLADGRRIRFTIELMGRTS